MPTLEELCLDAISFVDMVQEVATRAIEVGMTQDDKKKKRKGGWVGILLLPKGQDEPVFLRFRVGHVPRGSRSAIFCREKCYRVWRTGHLSSWPSRNLEDEKFGGGVWVNDLMIVAFSGFPERKDEVVVLLSADIRGMIAGERIAEVLSLSANHSSYQRLASHCRDLFPAAA